MQQDLTKRTGDLNRYINDLSLRIKSIENEMNEEDDGEGNLGATHAKLEKKLNASFQVMAHTSGEEDGVNIGEEVEKKEVTIKEKKEPDQSDDKMVAKKIQSETDDQPNTGVPQLRSSVGDGLNASQNFSKSSLKNEMMRKSSRLKTKKQEQQPSPMKSMSKEKGDPKKKAKKGGVVMDKESKEMIKQIEGKVEDLRKMCFNEINRLEAMLEKQEQETQHNIQNSVSSFKGDID